MSLWGYSDETEEATVDVELRVHLERVDDADTRWVWWADSVQLPGFSAAADHLPDLLSRARDVIREEKILPDEANITVLLVPIEHPSGATALNAVAPAPSLGTGGPVPRQAVSTRTLVQA
jgi:hypothetical protein